LNKFTQAYFKTFSAFVRLWSYIAIAFVLLFSGLTLYTTIIGSINGAVYPPWLLLVFVPILLFLNKLRAFDAIKIRQKLVEAGIIGE